MKTLLILLALLCPAIGWSAVAVDTSNVSHENVTGATLSISTTVASGDNLLVLECSQYTNAALFSAAPTFNSASMTKVASQYGVGYGTGSQSNEIWGLVSPTVGTYSITATIALTSQAVTCAAVPMSGAATSSTFGTPAYYPGTSLGEQSVTASGATSSGVYIGEGFTPSTSISTGGLPMTSLYILNSGNGWSFDYEAGSASGTFTYTPASGYSPAIVAIAVLPGSASCTNTGYTQAGTYVVPTPSSTVVYRQDGNFGTVPCSGSGASNSYYQHGTFGVN